MTFERITDVNRALINQFLEQHWFTTTMIVRGTEIDMTKVNGFYWAEECVIWDRWLSVPPDTSFIPRLVRPSARAAEFFTICCW